MKSSNKAVMMTLTMTVMVMPTVPIPIVLVVPKIVPRWVMKMETDLQIVRMGVPSLVYFWKYWFL